MGKLANIPAADLVIRINAAHREAFGNAKKAMECAAECGRLLIEAKELVPHGEWGSWIDANTEVGWRQSQKYMRLAKNWEAIEAKSKSNSHLNIEAALKLLREPPEEIEPYLKHTGQQIDPMSTPCGVPLWHRNEDGVMVNSRTLEPIEPDDEPVEVSEDVEYPAQVLINVLDSIENAKAVAEAYRKIFKASSFDGEAKAQIRDAIKLLIVKWRTVKSTLDRDDPAPERKKRGRPPGSKNKPKGGA